VGVLTKAVKLLNVLRLKDPLLFKALRLRVAASTEHSDVMSKLSCKTIVDIGANRGQFSLIARHYSPQAIIHSFEPLPEPASIFGKIFGNDPEVNLHHLAIGPAEGKSEMHISARDDSSSLLPISSLQSTIFPGTNETGQIQVRVAPLSAVLKKEDIEKPALLKLDVQGFELEALNGCDMLLSEFDWIYCECSFVELYSGQKLAAEVIAWLFEKGFKLDGVYNTSYGKDKLAVQADLLFKRGLLDQ
jgi:FkbM family methyltransferase